MSKQDMYIPLGHPGTGYLSRPCWYHQLSDGHGAH